MEICEICDETGEDRRTLEMSYLYDLTEVGLERRDGLRGYTKRTCKQCRGDLLEFIDFWTSGEVAARRKVREESSPERNVPVRMHGRTVMLTRDEYKRIYPGRETISVSQ